MIIDNEHQKIGIKPGSRNFVVKSSEELLLFPSCVYEHRDVKGKTNNYIVGDIENIDSKFPLSRGIIITEEEALLFSKLLENINIPKFSDIVIAAPEAELETGRELLKREINKVLSPRNLTLFPESFCGAITSLGVDKAINSFFTTLNLGSTTTGIGIFSSGNKKLLTSFTEASGTQVDDSIFKLLLNTYGNPIISINTVREIKEKFNFKNPEYTPIDIFIGGTQKTVDCSGEVMKVLKEYIYKVSSLLTMTISKLDSTTAFRALNSKLIFTGGMSNLPGLTEAIIYSINDKMNSEMKSITVEHGETAPAIGAYKLAGEYYE